MLATFPVPFEDELWYSVCARLRCRLRVEKPTVFAQALHGVRSALPLMDFPARLNETVAHISSLFGLTSEQIIDLHSLLPYYRWFTRQSRLALARQDMLTRDGGRIHGLLGMLATKVPIVQCLRFCPGCIETDRERTGEAYWHRYHQLPGVVFCLAHGAMLVDSPIRIRNQTTRAYVALEELADKGPNQTPDSIGVSASFMADIAQDSLWLLRQPCTPFAVEDLRSLYLDLLHRRGFALASGRLKAVDLVHAFCTHYSPALLRTLGCDLDPHVKDNWLVRILRESEKDQPPLRHILVARFLGRPLPVILNAVGCSVPAKLHPQPFGSGPWSCRNPVYPDYRSAVIKTVQIRKSPYVKGRWIGQFTCQCGYSYELTEGSAVESARVRNFGAIWESELQRLWQDTAVSVRRIAHRLGVDCLTVKRHAQRLSLSFPRDAVGRRTSRVMQARASTRKAKSKQAAARQLWAQAIRRWPDLGVTKLRRMKAKTYAWLYRHDREWLRQHSPRSSQSRSPVARVDWHQRDIDLAGRVAQAHLAVIARQPLRRATRTALGKALGAQAWLEKHASELPLTFAAVCRHEESRDDFALRRIQWANLELRKASTHLRLWQLVHKAGVEKLTSRPSIASALATQLAGSE